MHLFLLHSACTDEQPFFHSTRQDLIDGVLVWVVEWRVVVRISEHIPNKPCVVNAGCVKVLMVVHASSIVFLLYIPAAPHPSLPEVVNAFEEQVLEDDRVPEVWEALDF